jgi:hypothetical protein
MPLTLACQMFLMEHQFTATVHAMPATARNSIRTRSGVVMIAT